jgi:hypothetical protein
MPERVRIAPDHALSSLIRPEKLRQRLRDMGILPHMDTREILAAVKAEVSRLNKVIGLLEGGIPAPTPTTTTPKRKAHLWTAAQKKAMSVKQKALWAAKKKQKKG